ncbi:MAG TPA: hypothetical protein EYO33_09815 [Phycisphaerales bacterium]|nr:hypothetical protein [Phycisphaerales bacterium]
MSSVERIKLIGYLRELEDKAAKLKAALEIAEIADEALYPLATLNLITLKNGTELLSQWLRGGGGHHHPARRRGRVPYRRCRGFNGDGKPCLSSAVKGSVVCRRHQGQDQDWAPIAEYLSNPNGESI